MKLPVKLHWLDDKIARHSNYLERFDSERDYKIWLLWVVQNNFLVMNDPATYAIIARPVSWELEEATPRDEALFAFDLSGDALWMDFLWAPKQWGTVCEFLASTGKTWGGWEHRVTGKVHIVEIARLLRGQAIPEVNSNGSSSAREPGSIHV